MKYVSVLALGLDGLTEEQAAAKIKEAGMEPRIMWRDGKYLMGTTDARRNRVNLHIKDGKVVRAYIG